MTQATVDGLKALAEYACNQMEASGQAILVSTEDEGEAIITSSVVAVPIDAYRLAALAMGYIWDADTLSWVKASG
jgi:hypothetical protein